MSPGKPRNLTITNITSESVQISWRDPEHREQSAIVKYLIILKKDNSLITNITIMAGTNGYKIDHLTPNTKYDISITAVNYYTFGEEARASFFTSKGAF